MRWQQLVFDVGALDPERLEALLLEHGAASVTLTDAGEAPVLEPAPGETPLWAETRMTGLFDESADLGSVRTAIEAALPPDTLGSVRVETLEDRDWEREWLRDFRPMRFGERLWVCPRGMAPGTSDAVVVELDPGLAFGTGTHPTTALCLEWLDGLDLAGKTVLDYGCGSGILAIAALRLGASRAVGYDIDPQALAASRENAANNSVLADLALTIRQSDLGEPADVVVANILAGPLAKLANEILDLTITGGKLALSGILTDQVDEVTAAYAAGIRFDEPAYREQDGQSWARLTGIRL